MENNHQQQSGENSEQNDIKNFVANTKCGCCGQHPGLDNIHLLGRLAYSLLFITHCPSCNNVALAVVNHTGDKEIEIINDLTEAEESHFIEPISSSDVLDMHVLLQDFKGDFFTIFANYG